MTQQPCHEEAMVGAASTVYGFFRFARLARSPIIMVRVRPVATTHLTKQLADKDRRLILAAMMCDLIDLTIEAEARRMGPIRP
jgi:hypothetical protein